LGESKPRDDRLLVDNGRLTLLDRDVRVLGGMKKSGSDTAFFGPITGKELTDDRGRGAALVPPVAHTPTQPG
jgi:hypothetical protein